MNAGWLALALVIVALAIGGYALVLGVRQRRLRRRAAELEENSASDRA